MRWHTLLFAPLAALVLTPAFRSGTEAPHVAARSATPARLSPSTPAHTNEVPVRALVRPSFGNEKVARAIAKPFARPTPPARPPRRTAPELLMVGPDGIVYERIGPESMPAPSPEPVAFDKPRRWSDVPESPEQQPEEQPELEHVPAPREETATPTQQADGGVMVGPDGTIYEPLAKSAR